MSDHDPGEKNRPPSETLRSVAGLAIMEAAGDSAVRRRRGHSSSDEPSPVALRRTVPGEDGATASGGLGNGGVSAEIIPRSVWQAKSPLKCTTLKHPVEFVIISHTAGKPQYNQDGCSEEERNIKNFHVESRGFADIGYNFLVGGDGKIYEGRGWEYAGAHAKGYNSRSIGISFIGTFNDVLPPLTQIHACKHLIEEGMKHNKISKNYKLIAHRQVSQTESPGQRLYEELRNWEHWSPEI